MCGLEMAHISRCIMNIFAASHYDISKVSLYGQKSVVEGLGHMALSHRPSTPVPTPMMGPQFKGSEAKGFAEKDIVA